MLTAGQLYDAFDGPAGPAADFIDFVAQKKGLVADVGCGTGKLCGPLVQRGFRWLGLEPDDARHAAARAQATEHGGTLRHGGFTELGDDRADVVAAINGPFAYLLTGASRRLALKKSFDALVPGGVLVLDQPSFLWVLKHYRPPSPESATVGEWRIERSSKHVIDYDAGTWTHVDDFHAQSKSGGEKRARVEHVMAMIGYPEIRERLAEAGFRDVVTYRSIDAREPAPVEGPRFVVVAKRPA